MERDLGFWALSTSAVRPREPISSSNPICSSKDPKSSLRTLENQLFRLFARDVSSPDEYEDDQDRSPGSGGDPDTASRESSVADWLRIPSISTEGGWATGADATEPSSSGTCSETELGGFSRRDASDQIPPRWANAELSKNAISSIFGITTDSWI